MKKNKIDKANRHLFLDKNLVMEIEEKTMTKFKTKTEGIEYYLRMGLEYESKINDEHSIYAKLSKIQSDILFIKSLLMQMYANSNYLENNNIKDNKLLFDFIKQYQKSGFSD